MKFSWDPSDIHITTYSIQTSLEPLVVQVTDLLRPERTVRQKQRSERSRTVVRAVETAVETFLRTGRMIARENPDHEEELVECVREVEEAGQDLVRQSSHFALSPLKTGLRCEMMEAARNLLSVVTKLLLLADFVDLMKLMRRAEDTERSLKEMVRCKTRRQVRRCLGELEICVRDLLERTARREEDLLDPEESAQLGTARERLRVRAGELRSDWCRSGGLDTLEEVRQAVTHLLSVLRGEPRQTQCEVEGELTQYTRSEELVMALDRLDDMVTSLQFDASQVPVWRSRLEAVLRSVHPCPPALRCWNCLLRSRARLALEEVVRLRLAGVTGPVLNSALETMLRTTRSLRNEVSQSEKEAPLDLMISAAEAGHEAGVTRYAQLFTEHALKLVEVADLACRMGEGEEREDGVARVRQAASVLQSLYTQVISAARVLTVRKESEAAHQNMAGFKSDWEEAVQVLTQAVDNIVTIEDFLAVSESQILEDVRDSCIALRERDLERLTKLSKSVEARTVRISEVVQAEMEKYEPGLYTETVLEAVRVLQTRHVPQFVGEVELAVETLLEVPARVMEDKEMIDCSRQVCDGVREVRRVVMLGLEEESSEAGETTERSDNDLSVETMRQLPEQERSKILEKVEEIKTAHGNFEKEVRRWEKEEEDNQLIVLAKIMLEIVMEMTNFTEGVGPIKTSREMIRAAQRISSVGAQLDKVARRVADQCEQPRTKKDLLAYLQRIALYCHQLNMCSKVKAEVTYSDGELTVSALESATSLLQAAKNLLTSVILTINCCYVVSIKCKLIPGNLRDREILERDPEILRGIEMPERDPVILTDKEMPERDPEILRGREMPERDQVILIDGEIAKRDPEILRGREMPERDQVILIDGEIANRDPEVLRDSEMQERDPEILRDGETPERDPEVFTDKEIPEKDSKIGAKTVKKTLASLAVKRGNYFYKDKPIFRAQF